MAPVAEVGCRAAAAVVGCRCDGAADAVAAMLPCPHPAAAAVNTTIIMSLQIIFTGDVHHQQDPSTKYDLRHEIGRGSFGSAFLVSRASDRADFVLKRVRLAKQTPWQRDSTMQERKLVRTGRGGDASVGEAREPPLHRHLFAVRPSACRPIHPSIHQATVLRHPFIVPCVESWVTGDHTVCMIYAYCQGGDLASYLGHVRKQVRCGACSGMCAATQRAAQPPRVWGGPARSYSVGAPHTPPQRHLWSCH